MTMVRINNRPAMKAFEGLFDTLFRDFEQTAGMKPHPASSRFQPLVNVAETADAYHLELNAPGRRKEGFRLQVEQDVLTIRYEQPQADADTTLKRIRQEFSTPGFSRSFTLQEKVEASAIQAKYEDGILKVLLPKKAVVKPAATLIEVQ